MTAPAAHPRPDEDTVTWRPGSRNERSFPVSSSSPSSTSGGRALLSSLWGRFRSGSSPQSAGWALLPLRAFLGVTFVYAGLSKLFDQNYLDNASPLGVHAQMAAAAVTSPIGSLVSFSAHYSTVTGLAIAFGEAAVGLGVLLGLFTRLAALGGFVLALSFFLTVSWTTRPYYYGADIGFAFAWTPLLIAGDAGVYSLTARLRSAVRHKTGLQTGDSPDEQRTGEAEVQRRTVLRGGLIAAAMTAVGVTAGSVFSLSRRPARVAASRGPHQPPPPPAPGVPAASAGPAPTGAGTVIAAAASVPIGSSKQFTTPDGATAYLLHPAKDIFLAFNAACTHQGCPVSYIGPGFHCPCHGSAFDQNGQATAGPANTPLLKIPVKVIDGQVTTTTR